MTKPIKPTKRQKLTLLMMLRALQNSIQANVAGGDGILFLNENLIYRFDATHAITFDGVNRVVKG
jgi:hypothetical protein